jgi:molybdopterin/thiamine biosynthesis adenylyltransferase
MHRPRIKPEHAPYRIAGGRIRIGGVTFGIAAEVDDPAGSLWTLLLSMDGTRSTEEIVARVTRLHPDYSPAAVRAALGTFIASGYVEDSGAPDPAELTGRDKERHERARGYFRWLDLTPRVSTWDPQAALRRARVTIAGVGGTGGVAALALAASGVGSLHCVDPDVVELSNLSRQIIYSENDIGRPKADAASSRLRRLNRDITVSSERLRIRSAADVVPLARGCDVLLLAADRPAEIRAWANLGCIAAGTPWVEASYHGPLSQVGVYVPGQGACWECLHAIARDRHDALGANGADTAKREAAIGNAVGAVSAGISGYLAAHQVIALITGIPAPEPGTIHAVNLAALDAPFRFAEPAVAGCPACGAAS